jgi:hypothetical protein
MAWAAAVLGGCVAANTPGDVTVVSVRTVDEHDVAEMPGPNAPPFLGMASDRQLRELGYDVTGGEKPHRLWLKVEFTSAMNLARFVIDRSYTLGAYGHLCSRPKTVAASTYIYWQGKRLGNHEPDPITPSGTIVGTPITYYIFVGVTGPKFTPPAPELEYDLRQHPEDVCFNLRGGKNSGFGYRSNTVVVSKAGIEAALRTLPLGKW